MKKFVLIQSIIIVILVVIVLLMRGCSNDERKAKDLEITRLKLDKQNLEEIVNKQGDTITTQKAVTTDNQNTIKTLSDEAFDLKKKNEKLVKTVLAFSSQKVQTKLDSVQVPYVDSAERKRFSDSLETACIEVITYYENNSIIVPRTARDSTSDYAADITATQSGININSLVVNDSVYNRIIEKKGGFFRKVMSTNKKGVTKPRLKFHVPKSIEFQTLHTSPFVKVTGQTSIFYTPKKNHQLLLKAGLIIGGIYLGSKL